MVTTCQVWRISANCWKSTYIPILSKVSEFTSFLKEWNKEDLRCIFKKKRILLARLGGIKKSLCISHSTFLYNLETEFTAEYNPTLEQKELCWLQNPHIILLEELDTNFKVFHLSTIVRRRR